MKKMLYLILCLLFVPVVVNADMGAPSISEYEVIVSNPEGVKFYNFDGEIVATIPYDTILTITYESSENDVLYGYIYYNGKNGYIDLNDTTLYSTDIDFSTHFESGDGKEVYVYKDGCYMFSGPSQIYGTNGVEIPVGTTLEILYYDEVWSYVEYNGVSGWIYTYEYESEYDLYDNLDVAVAHINTDIENSKLITVKDATIYDNDGNKIDISIPEFTILEYNYYFNYAYYITYNGVSGWIYASYEEAPARFVYEGSILTYAEVTLYTRSSYMTYIKSNITLPVNYETEALCWAEFGEYGEDYYVCQMTYKNNTYYVIDIYDVYIESEELWEDFLSAYTTKSSSSYTFTIGKDMDLYDQINGSVIVTIPEGTSLEARYYMVYVDDDTYVYVTYNEVSGWLKYEDEYMTGYYEDNEEDNNNKDTIYVDDYDDEPGVDNESSVFNQILAAFIVALVIALTAIVLTIYINKKKDKKNVSH